jgi:hypothetical protein
VLLQTVSFGDVAEISPLAILTRQQLFSPFPAARVSLKAARFGSSKK